MIDFKDLNIIISLGTGVIIYRNEKFEIVLDDDTYYGISWNKDFFFLSHLNTINKFDRNFNFLKRYTHKEAFVHQIAYFDDKLYAVDPIFYRVTCFDENLELIETINPENIIKKNHINSIFKDEKYIYLCAHNADNGSFVSFHNHDWSFIKRVENLGYQNHNVFRFEDKIYTLSSKNCTFVEFDLDTNSKKDIKLEIPGKWTPRYCRGLAKYDDGFLIGLPGTGARGDRDKDFGGLLVLNNDFEILELIRLPISGQVRDVRILNKKDYAHNGIILDM